MLIGGNLVNPVLDQRVAEYFLNDKGTVRAWASDNAMELSLLPTRRKKKYISFHFLVNLLQLSMFTYIYIYNMFVFLFCIVILVHEFIYMYILYDRKPDGWQQRVSAWQEVVAEWQLDEKSMLSSDVGLADLLTMYGRAFRLTCEHPATLVETGTGVKFSPRRRR